MIKRLSDDEMSEIYATVTKYGFDFTESSRGMQRIQIELQLRMLDLLKDKK